MAGTGGTSGPHGTLEGLSDERRARRPLRLAASAAFGALGPAVSALAGGLALGDAVGAAAIGLSGCCAVRCLWDWVEDARLALMDGQGGRRVLDLLLARAVREPVGVARGTVWAVFDHPGAEPRVMGHREYVRFRKEQPRMLEVQARLGGIVAYRLVDGRPESRTTGEPAIEGFEPDGSRSVAFWFLDGCQVTREEAGAAHREWAEAMREEHGPMPWGMP